MPAKFCTPRGQFANENMLPTLYGKRFPTDDIQALWHMVPGEFSVEFSTGTHEFVIKDLNRLSPGRHRFESPTGMRLIPANKSFEYNRWLEAFQDLCKEAREGIMSGQDIDPKRAP